VVEDDAEIGGALRRSLRLEGYDVRLAEDGVAALEESTLFEPDAVVLDLGPPRGSAFLAVGDLRLNPDTREVQRGDRPLELTSREFELLEYLMRNERLVVSREALLENVWGYQVLVETNTVDVFVSNLRRKLEAGGEPRVLHTVRGAGYVLRAA